MQQRATTVVSCLSSPGVDAWLTLDASNLATSYAILDDREGSYEHRPVTRLRAIIGDWRMELWVQPCSLCFHLYGKLAAEAMHEDLTLNGVGVVKESRVEVHYTCVSCDGVFARVLVRPPSRRIWMLLNAGRH